MEVIILFSKVKVCSASTALAFYGTSTSKLIDKWTFTPSFTALLPEEQASLATR